MNIHPQFVNNSPEIILILQNMSIYVFLCCCLLFTEKDEDKDTFSWKSCRAVEPNADMKEFLSKWIIVGCGKAGSVEEEEKVKKEDLPMMLTVLAWLWLPGWQDSQPLLMCTCVFNVAVISINKKESQKVVVGGWAQRRPSSHVFSSSGRPPLTAPSKKSHLHGYHQS